MNHSRKFWEVRNGYAGEMRGLWEKGYTGEGVWGRGRELEGGGFEERDVDWGDEGVQSLCGGTFRSRRGRKRRRGVKKEELSYAERQARRVERKFGRGGEKLGEDEDVKSFLEGGKKVKGKPRVANSARGRELRANAALVRLGAQKVEEDMKRNEEEEMKEGVAENASASEYEEEESKGEDAVDVNGSRLLDGRGHGMVRVCEDEELDDVHVKQEMEELQGLSQPNRRSSHSKPSNRTTRSTASQQAISSEKPRTRPTAKDTTPGNQDGNNSRAGRLEDYGVRSQQPEILTGSSIQLSSEQEVSTSTPSSPSASVQDECPICSTKNDSAAWLCTACSHVLKPHLSPGCWKCTSSVCQESQYLNPGDFGTCGACGASKPA